MTDATRSEGNRTAKKLLSKVTTQKEDNPLIWLLVYSISIFTFKYLWFFVRTHVANLSWKMSCQDRQCCGVVSRGCLMASGGVPAAAPLSVVAMLTRSSSYSRYVSHTWPTPLLGSQPMFGLMCQYLLSLSLKPKPRMTNDLV